MQNLIVSIDTFNDMLIGFVKSGCTFEAEEMNNGLIEITFTGGY